MLQLLRDFVPRPLTGALPMDYTGGLPSLGPPTFDPEKNVSNPALDLYRGLQRRTFKLWT